MSSQNKEQNKNKGPENESFWAQAAKYSEIAFIFPAATVVGLLVGYGLDRWLHTTWLYIVGLLVGILAGFVQLARIASSGMK